MSTDPQLQEALVRQRIGAFTLAWPAAMESHLESDELQLWSPELSVWARAWERPPEVTRPEALACVREGIPSRAFDRIDESAGPLQWISYRLREGDGTPPSFYGMVIGPWGQLLVAGQGVDESAVERAADLWRSVREAA